MAEASERMQRIADNEKVRWLAITDASKKVIQTKARQKGEESKAKEMAGSIVELARKARSAVREIDPINDLAFLRIRSTTTEYMIGTDKDFYLIVNQEAPKPEDATK